MPVQQMEIRPFTLEAEPVHPGIAELRGVRERALGPYWVFAERISKARFPPRQEQYSVTLISAVAYGEVVANQLVEGGVDAAVYEHFIFRMLEYIRI